MPPTGANSTKAPPGWVQPGDRLDTHRSNNGPIQPGDLLTTASILGHAMKATPVNLAGIALYRPGTIIGKALEPWNGGVGVIQVLIVLQ
ncbi:MAG: hypothetical protein DYG89_45365 [Caldilinea sp. CFX5]|nr:hypothetical protein [Caldilinea sp. CFX5]